MKKEDVELMLKSVDESLTVGRWSLSNDGEILSCTTRFDLKGNSQMIKKLESLGWGKERREKVCSGEHRGIYARNQYSGYTMQQIMNFNCLGK